MTVIWFNNDDGQHSITTLANSSYSPPKAIDSGVIPPDGGSFIYQFNQPGSYVYLDQFNPSVHGIVNVGSAIEQGKTFNMYIRRYKQFAVQSKSSTQNGAIICTKNCEISACNFFDIQCHNSKFNRQAAL
jgi:hypothetical protein